MNNVLCTCVNVLTHVAGVDVWTCSATDKSYSKDTAGQVKLFSSELTKWFQPVKGSRFRQSKGHAGVSSRFSRTRFPCESSGGSCVSMEAWINQSNGKSAISGIFWDFPMWAYGVYGIQYDFNNIHCSDSQILSVFIYKRDWPNLVVF